MKKERIYYASSFRGVKQLRDFYAKAGILERLERGVILKKQLRAHAAVLPALVYGSVFAHWLSFAPRKDADIPPGELWVLLPEEV